jgi:hypothetical protein
MCPPGAISAPLPGGGFICAGPPDFFCAEGLRRTCTDDRDVATCSCSPMSPAPPAPPYTCRLVVDYRQSLPSESAIVSLPPGCDGAALELAIAVLLAKLLGMPR